MSGHSISIAASSHGRFTPSRGKAEPDTGTWAGDSASQRTGVNVWGFRRWMRSAASSICHLARRPAICSAVTGTAMIFITQALSPWMPIPADISGIFRPCIMTSGISIWRRPRFCWTSRETAGRSPPWPYSASVHFSISWIASRQADRRGRRKTGCPKRRSRRNSFRLHSHFPKPVCGQGPDSSKSGHRHGHAGQEANCRKIISDNNVQTETGPFAPPTYNRIRVIFPSEIGGADWGGGPFNPALGYLFINVNDLGQFNRLKDPELRTRGRGKAGWHQHAWRADRPLSGRRVPADDFAILRLILFCNQPPWGELIAMNVHTGEAAWRVPLGRDRWPAAGEAEHRPSR